MLTRVFGQINSATSILLVVYALLLGGVYFYINPVLDLYISTAAGKFLLNPIFAWGVVITGNIGLMLGYQRLFYGQHKLVKHHALVPFVLLPLVILAGLNTLLVSTILAVFLFGLSYSWLAVYSGQKLLSVALNAGFILGIGSLFSSIFTLFLPFTWVVYMVYGRLNVRTFIIPVIGYLTIWIDAIALDYLLADSTFVWHFFINQFKWSGVLGVWQANWPILVFFGILLLPGIAEFTVTFNRANVFKRQTFVVLILLLAGAIPLFLFGGKTIVPLVVFVPIIAVLFVNYLQYVKRKWVRELALWLVLVSYVVLLKPWL